MTLMGWRTFEITGLFFIPFLCLSVACGHLGLTTVGSVSALHSLYLPLHEHGPYLYLVNIIRRRSD